MSAITVLDGRYVLKAKLRELLQTKFGNDYKVTVRVSYI